MPYCPFCDILQERIVLENEHAFALYDAFPISMGHILIIPKRHIPSFFAATVEERNALLNLLDEARAVVLERYAPDGFNIGINDGSAAGQTVPHLHIHLIPRYIGDMPDPRGGVRWIFPDKAEYWR